MKRFLALILTIAFCVFMSTMIFVDRDALDAEQTLKYIEENAEAPPLTITTPAPTPTPDPEYYTISFVGDCTLASANGGGDYKNTVGDDYAYPFAETVQYLSDDDFTLANLECALTTHNVGAIELFLFKADPSYVNIMLEGSVEFVTLANNHAKDYGTTGYEETRETVEAAGIGYAGFDEWALYDANGLTIGVYAFSFGTVAQIEAGIAALKEAGAEFIIAAMHWGTEGTYSPTETQIKQGHAAIDAGADVVYGSHSHTLQPVEEYEGKYIFYSMGNWSFGGNTGPRDRDTAIARLEVTKNGDEANVTGYTIIPCSLSGGTTGNNYQPTPYEEGSEEYERVLSKLDGSFEGSDLVVNYYFGE